VSRGSDGIESEGAIRSVFPYGEPTKKDAQMKPKNDRSNQSLISRQVFPNLETLEDRLTPSASFLEPQFTIAAVTGAEAGPPAVVVVNSSGDFVATWESLETDGSGIGVYAQRFFADGTANGDALRVNTTTAGNQSRPTIATDGDGHVVIAWQGESATGGAYDIYYTTGDFDGGDTWLTASETMVNVETTGNQIHATVAMDANGNFAIAWQSDQNIAAVTPTGIDI
jgi:hypothetical protein